MRIFIILILNIFFISILFSQENNISNSLENKMNEYAENKKLEWSYNPLRKLESDKYFYGLADPNNYITRYWVGSVLNHKELYENKNFRTEDIYVFHSPKLATELSIAGFHINDNVHRFNIGVAYSALFNLASYRKGKDQLYGTSFIFGTYLQVEAYFDYVYNNVLKFRISPVRHISFHTSGDILGDSSLNDKEFRDTGYEQVHFSVAYRYGWLSFYGGSSVAYTGYKKSNFVNIFNIHSGVDFRVPIWGEISFITGIYFGYNYNEYNVIDRKTGGDGYDILYSYYKWVPDISFATGFEIYNFTVAFKYDYVSTKQLYIFDKQESRVGLEVSIFF